MITIALNGEEYTLAEGTTLDALLSNLQLSQQRVAVEINRKIIPRSQYGQHVVEAQDCIEIVAAIGGG